MRRNKRRIVAAVAVVGALAAGGAAFTDNIGGSPITGGTVAGYATSAVSGATATDVNYTLSPNGTQITAVNFTFADKLDGDTLKLAFDNAALYPCLGTQTDATGVIAPGTYTAGQTKVTCSLASTGNQDTTAATSLQVAVTNN
jgi:hypothetical protein